MPGCAVITCRARSTCLSKTKGGVSFHRFPKDPNIREIWIDATGRGDWIPTKTSTICSRHFTIHDYSTKKSGNKYLREGAVPRENIVRICSFKEASVSSSNASTPRKKKLKQIIFTKDTVIKRQRKQIKRIQAQNRRLKKKIFKMEDIINDLQSKFSIMELSRRIKQNSRKRKISLGE
ncbi:hypothetical protein ABMA27_009461 [Loxostege sticticalis]|uniref:THAP-type domain-containing protein n=1 Tax=Loxostege sticticalis TaxID=481309 RepID=A0ABR3H813_LOXSC